MSKKTKSKKTVMTNSIVTAIGNNCAGIFIPGCRVHEHGLGLEMDINTIITDWSNIAPFLNRFSTAGKWMLGDWVKFGLALFTEEQVFQVLQDTGYRFETIMKIVRVCTKVEFVRRRKELSFEHHECVARLKPEEQTKWLDIAVDEGLSRKELRASIKAQKVVHEDDIEKAQRKAKPATTDGLMEYFLKWTEEQERNGPIEDMDYSRRMQLRDSLQPIIEYHAKLAVGTPTPQ